MTFQVFFKEETKNYIFLKKEVQYYFNKIFQIETTETTNINEAQLILTLTPDHKKNDHIDLTLSQGKAVISGNSKIALHIAFYRFLFEFGARFLRPNRQNEILPRLTLKSFQDKTLDLHETASYQHRGTCIEGADSFENVLDFIDWLPKIGLNSFFIQFENPYSFLEKWYTHFNNNYAEKVEFSEEMAEKMSAQIDEAMASRGVLHHRVGHGWTSETLGYSSKFGWDQAEPLREELKPLVAEVKGKRELFHGAPLITNLDYSNPEVIEKMSDLVLNYAKKHPEVNLLHFWLSDATNNVCECENCQGHTLSDQYVKILNRIDEKLTHANLSTQICFLLYNELIFAPEIEKIKNPKRFTLMFAPITRTFEKSYAEVNYQQDIPEPPKFLRNHYKFPTTLEENLTHLFAWQKVFNGDSFVYDYHLGRAHYGDFGYMAISQIMHRDCQYLEKIHLDGMIACQELRSGFPHNFPTYVMAKTLWDKNVSYEDLKASYFSALYGEKWTIAVKYLENLSKFSSCDYVLGIESQLNPRLAVNFEIAVNTAEEFLPFLMATIKEETGYSKSQWLLLSYHRNYVLKLGRAFQALASGKQLTAQTYWNDFIDYVRGIEPLVQEELDVYRITEVTKNYMGFKLP